MKFAALLATTIASTTNECKEMLKNTLFRTDVLLFVVCVAFFLVYPNLDLKISALFYDDDTRFYVREWLPVHVIYKLFAYIQVPVLIGLTVAIVQHAKKNEIKRKRCCTYLLCCLLIGPGILVNTILKDNSLGRPRPKHIENFGGEHEYAKPFEYSGACARNCSFTSGHAAIGYVFLTLFWVTRRRSLFIAGMVLGLGLGVMRIAQGGHFLSDIVFSFWVIYFSGLWLAKLFSLVNPSSHPMNEEQGSALANAL